MYQTGIQEIFTIWYGEIEFLANEEHREVLKISLKWETRLCGPNSVVENWMR